MFELDKADIAEVTALGTVLTGTQATVSRRFDQPLPTVLVPLDEPKVLAAVLDSLSEPIDVVRDLVNKTKNAFRVRVQHKQTPAESAAKAELAAVIEGFDQVQRAVTNLVWSKVPTFFYFDDYALLPGRIELSDLEGSDGIASSAQ